MCRKPERKTYVQRWGLENGEASQLPVMVRPSR